MTDLRKAAEMALEALDYEAREEPESIWIAEREALRQALDKPPVKSYCGGKPNYCTPEVAKRKTLAELLDSTPVDETAKGVHEWVGFTDGEKKYLKALGYVGIDDIESRLKRMNT